jgi:hypothetical protein
MCRPWAGARRVLCRSLAAGLLLLATAVGCDDKSDPARDALLEQRAELVKQQAALETLFKQRTQGRTQFTEQEQKDLWELARQIRLVKADIDDVNYRLLTLPPP